MSDSTDSKPPKRYFNRLALWVAGGGRVAPWCQKNGVGVRTAYRWSTTPEFQAKVEEYRRGATERAIGLLARHAVTAIEGMVRLAKGDHDSRADM